MRCVDCSEIACCRFHRPCSEDTMSSTARCGSGALKLRCTTKARSAQTCGRGLVLQRSGAKPRGVLSLARFLICAGPLGAPDKQQQRSALKVLVQLVELHSAAGAIEEVQEPDPCHDPDAFAAEPSRCHATPPSQQAGRANMNSTQRTCLWPCRCVQLCCQRRHTRHHASRQ
jgi:hypothetical protein